MTSWQRSPLTDGSTRRCKVLEVNGDRAVVQLFEASAGINLAESQDPLSGPSAAAGRVARHAGPRLQRHGRAHRRRPEIIAGGAPGHQRPADEPGRPQLPQRVHPDRHLTIDGLNTLVRGQKLPIFSGSGLPHAQLAAQIARQARVLDDESNFAVVFAAIGITFEESEFFVRSSSAPAPSTARCCSPTWPTTPRSSVSPRRVWR